MALRFLSSEPRAWWDTPQGALTWGAGLFHAGGLWALAGGAGLFRAGGLWALGPLTHAWLQLLTVNPEHRFSSLQDMQAAPALAGVLWGHLSEKRVEPDFVPNVSLWAAQWGDPGLDVASSTGRAQHPSLCRKAVCTATPPSSWRR